MAIEVADYVKKAESSKSPNVNGFANAPGSPDSSQFVTGDYSLLTSIKALVYIALILEEVDSLNTFM